jgi:hypothetical protein
MGAVGMLNSISGMDTLTLLKIIGVLIPVLSFVWIVGTVMSLHRREVYFWGLGSTWVTLVACPLSVGIMCTSVLSRLHDDNAELFQVPIMAGAALYVAAFAYSLFYNYRATRSAWLALSTTFLQQFSLLGVLFLILRLERRAMDRR